MSGDDLVGLRDELTTELRRNLKDSEVRRRRTTNLNWIKALSVDQLLVEKKELLVPIAATASHERVFIQYPGWEAKQKTAVNPRDFRPKVRKGDATSSTKDLRFKDLWDAVFDNLRTIEDEKNRLDFASVFGILFYRMAYLVDYEPRPGQQYDVTVIVEDQDVGKEKVFYDSFWTYKPPPKTVNLISSRFPNWSGMSFEAFLHYNSLLAWNEDGKCLAKFPNWTLAKATGRVNTLLTHMRMVGLAKGVVELSSVLDDYARRRGVCPAHSDEIIPICGEFVRTGNEELNHRSKA